MPGQQIIDHTYASNFTQVVFKGMEVVAPIPPMGICNLINTITSGGLFTIDNFMAWHTEMYNMSVLTNLGDVGIDGRKIIDPSLWFTFTSPVMAWAMLSANMALGGLPNCKIMSDTNLQFTCRVTNNDMVPININLFWWLLIGVTASQKIIVDTALT